MNVRDATRDDADAIALVCNAATHALYGQGDASASEVRSWFDIPGIAATVVEDDGEIVAIRTRWRSSCPTRSRSRCCPAA